MGMSNGLLVGLVEAWLNDEVSGKRFAAHAGLDFEVENGNVGSVVGIKGRACNFASDIANRLSRVDDGNFEFGNTSFSMAAWVNQTGTPNNPYLAKFTQTTQRSFLFEHRATNDRCRIGVSSAGTGGTFVDAPTATPDSTWQLVAAGFDRI